MKRSDTGPFSVIPEWLFEVGISPRAYMLYGLLAIYANFETGKAWPSRATLAERMLCSLDSLDRALAQLVEAGAIDRVHRHRDDGSLTSNEYVVIRVPPAHVRLGRVTDAAGGHRTGAAT